MSIMPNPPSRNKLSPAIRTLVLWSVIVILAVIIWQTKQSTDRGSSHQISYSNFLLQVENHNIATATLALAEHSGSARQSPRACAGISHDGTQG
jgi:FtsH Extracellular